MISRRIFAACAALCLAWLIIGNIGGQKALACTAPCTKAQITSDINANWPDNTSGAITPAILRSTVLELVNSYLDVNGSSSFACSSNQFLSAIATLSSYTCSPAVTSVGTNGGVAGGTITATGTITADGNYSGFALHNCTLAASVGSNLLTVSLKDNGGNDPSAASPCYLNYRNVTAATGSTTLVSQTAALSISTNATGASLGSSNNTAFRFWVVAFNNGGANVLALYNASTGSATSASCFPIDETQAQSSTPISGSATSAGVYYTPNGTTVTSKAIRVLGYVEYNSTGLATAGTYASGPNFIQAMGPGVHLPCEPISQFHFTTTSSVSCNNNNSAAVTPTNLLKAITPTSAANLIRITSTFNFSAATSSGGFDWRMFRGSGGTGLGNGVLVQSATAGNTNFAGTLNWDKPNTTSSTTYVLQCSAAFGGSGTLTLPANDSQIEVSEIMG